MPVSESEHLSRETAPVAAKWVGWVIICAVLWGSAFPAIKRVFAHWTESGVEIDFAMRSLFSGVRFTIAGLALLLWSKAPLREWQATPFKWVLGMALTQTVGQYVLFYWGLELSSGALASLLVASGSYWWVILAPRFGHSTPLTGRQWWVLGAGAVGVTIAVYSPGVSAGNPHLGVVLLLGASFFGAVGLLYFQRIRPTMGSRAGTGYALAIGGVVLMLLGLPAILRGELAVFDSFVLGWTLWLAFVSAAAFALWNHLSTQMAAYALATYRFLIPLCGVFESLILLDNEKLTPAMMVGGAVVLISMTLVNRGRVSK